MDSHRLELLEDLARLRQKTRAAAAEFLDKHTEEVEAYRTQISEGIKEALAHLRQNIAEVSAHNKVCEQLMAQASEYVDWLQWSLWDLPYFAVALRPSADRFRRAVVACGMVYLSARVFDDVIDRHFWYKGKHPSLLATASETFSTGQGAEGLTILAGLLLCFDGLSKLADPAQDGLEGVLQSVISSVRLAVIGLIMEHSGPVDWNRTYYDRLVQLKNVDYWRALYASIDAKRASPLDPFLERYYTLAQYLNDVQDFSEDLARGQPNLLSLYLPAQDDGPTVPFTKGQAIPVAPSEVESFLATTFLDLGRLADSMPAPERLIAQLKLAESLQEAHRLGLFMSSTAQPEQGDQPAAVNSHLHWNCEIQEVMELVGGDALQRVSCAACGSRDRSYLFQKQGFSFHRCTKCSHIYVSPRINAKLQEQIGQEWDGLDVDNSYLQVQRIYAMSICHLLRSRAPGARLLDLGFGHGYLMQLAQAYGFEVYGIDSSKSQVDGRRAHFGKHVYHAVIGNEEIPWKSFDVVVMSHILEHLPEPAASLRRVREIMNPAAVLYIAVPDMDSLQFRVFGKKWDVVNPMVHFQYFTEKSLSRLLLDCGFTALDRIKHPPLPAEMAPRWLRLLRRLGGSDSGELAMLAQVPREDE